MSNSDNTRNVATFNQIGDGYYANSFYGTYDHFQRIGWYFDKIVPYIGNLNDCLDVLTGRFVLVQNEDAIFMRDYNYDNQNFEFYPYSTTYEWNEENGEFIYNSGDAVPITGFRFIGYATRLAKLLIDENGNTTAIDVNGNLPYKIAKTKNVQQMSAYYFPTDKNKNVFRLDDNNYKLVQELELDKDKYEEDGGYDVL